MRGFFSISRALIQIPKKNSIGGFTFKQMNKMQQWFPTHNFIIRLATSMTGLRLANLISPQEVSEDAISEDNKNEVEQALKTLLGVSSGELMPHI